MNQEIALATMLEDLMKTLESRRCADLKKSYTAKLLQEDEDILLKKVIEEAGEVLLAAKKGQQQPLVHELADLWFHCLVVMTRYNINLSDIATELSSRRGCSGLEEKEARQP